MKAWVFILSVLGSIGTFFLLKESNLINILGFGMTLLICFSIFMVNLFVGKIAEVVRKTCAPDVIYYNRSSELVKAKIYWNFGIHVVPIFLVSFYGVAVLGKFNWWQLLLVIILVSIFNFMIDTIIESKE